MKPEQREELKKAAQKATPGPWEATHQTDDECNFVGYFIEAPNKTISDDGTAPDANDALYIAAAHPAAILSLIAQVEALTVPDDYFAPVVLNPTCACAKCNPNAAGRMMIVCATCGNKRCPHATDHRLACTDSNEPGQPGSSYGPTIPAIPGTKEGA